MQKNEQALAGIRHVPRSQLDVAPMELATILAPDCYKDFAPTELVRGPYGCWTVTSYSDECGRHRGAPSTEAKGKQRGDGANA